jgi:hypothetical protein
LKASDECLARDERKAAQATREALAEAEAK